MKASSFIFLLFSMLFLFSCANENLDPNSDNGSSSVIQSKTPFTDFMTGYMDESIDYEYSKPEVATLRSIRNTENMNLNEKYELLLSLKDSITRNTRRADTYEVEDEEFYSKLTLSAIEEVDGIIMISEEPIAQTRTSENSEFIQSAYGNYYNKFQILEMAEDYINSTDSTKNSRGIKKTSVRKWDNNIYYRYQGHLDGIIRNNIRTGMNDWQVASGKIKFIEVPNNAWYRFLGFFGHNFYIEKINDPNIGGRATLGRHLGFPYLQMSSSSDIRTARHELGHVLGLSHEHMRYDRDSYINVYWNNIKPGYQDQFYLIPKDERRYFYIDIWVIFWKITIKIPYDARASDIYGSFDYNSIMMYPSTSFSANGKYTMTYKDGSYIGRSTTLSQKDINTIQSIYR